MFCLHKLPASSPWHSLNKTLVDDHLVQSTPSVRSDLQCTVKGVSVYRTLQMQVKVFPFWCIHSFNSLRVGTVNFFIFLCFTLFLAFCSPIFVVLFFCCCNSHTNLQGFLMVLSDVWQLSTKLEMCEMHQMYF